VEPWSALMETSYS